MTLPSVDRLLAAEVDWLKSVRQNVLIMTQGGNEAPVDEVLLEGHLCVTKELVAFLSPESKYELGGDAKRINLIRVRIGFLGFFMNIKKYCSFSFQELIEDFIFPFSKVYLQLEQSSVLPAEQVN